MGVLSLVNIFTISTLSLVFTVILGVIVTLYGIAILFPSKFLEWLRKTGGWEERRRVCKDFSKAVDIVRGVGTIVVGLIVTAYAIWISWY